jgi:hypothetical protein
MKKILILLFSIFTLSSNAAEVYYCSDDSQIGFKTTKNYQIGTFPNEKFKIKIDFKNKNINSKEIFFTKLAITKCMTYSDNLYCINDYGVSFSFNKKTSRFMRSSMINSSDDDVTLAHGLCEKF